jgi:hypothetical protein
MSLYRIWHYPLRENCFKHVYVKGRRGGGKGSTAEDNAAAILDKLAKMQKLEESLSRSRRTLRDLILCNKFDYFCTFTFKPEKVDRYNFNACKKKITDSFDNYKYRYSPDFRYIIVPELHKDGGIHFHGMVSGILPEHLTVPDMIYKRNKRNGKLELVPNTKGYVDWAYYSKKLGFFSCSKVKHYEKCARYVSKYITKGLVMNFARGQRVFMASTGLDRPELGFDEEDMPCLFHKADYENEFVRIKESRDSFGALPEWDWRREFGSTSEMYDEEPDAGGPLLEEEIFERLTGVQLSIKGMNANAGQF